MAFKSGESGPSSMIPVITVSGRSDVYHILRNNFHMGPVDDTTAVFISYSLFSVRWRRWSWSMNWISVRPTWGWMSRFPGTMNTKTAPGYLLVRSGSGGNAAPEYRDWMNWRSQISHTDESMWCLIAFRICSFQPRTFEKDFTVADQCSKH